MKSLLHDVSRSLFWNTALLPLVTAAGILLSILVRRSFGLESGLYDVALGIANSILFYSGLGLAGSLPKFLPEMQVKAGGQAIGDFVVRLASIRLAVVIAILAPLNLWAGPFAALLGLGSGGALYIHLLSAIVIGRAVLDFAYRTFDALFQQAQVNVLTLFHGVVDLGLVTLVVAFGMSIYGVIGALGASAIVLSIVASIAAMKHIRTLPQQSTKSAGSPAPIRLWKLCGVNYLRDLSLYFATPAFASPVC